MFRYFYRQLKITNCRNPKELSYLLQGNNRYLLVLRDLIILNLNLIFTSVCILLFHYFEEVYMEHFKNFFFMRRKFIYFFKSLCFILIRICVCFILGKPMFFLFLSIWIVSKTSSNERRSP